MFADHLCVLRVFNDNLLFYTPNPNYQPPNSEAAAIASVAWVEKSSLNPRTGTTRVTLMSLTWLIHAVLHRHHAACIQRGKGVIAQGKMITIFLSPLKFWQSIDETTIHRLKKWFKKMIAELGPIALSSASRCAITGIYGLWHVTRRPNQSIFIYALANSARLFRTDFFSVYHVEMSFN